MLRGKVYATLIIGGALSIVLLINGCIYFDHKAFLNPTLTVESSNIGNGQNVGLKVIDGRPNNIIGYRGMNPTMYKGGVITSDQDIAKLLEEKISDGMKIKGFVPTSYSKNNARSIKVTLQWLEYHPRHSFVNYFRAKTSLKVIAKNSNNEFENFYNAGKEERDIFFFPSAGKNEQVINSALSEALQRLFDDQNLFEFLGN